MRNDLKNIFILMVFIIASACSKTEPPPVEPPLTPPPTQPPANNPSPGDPQSPPVSTARLVPIKIESAESTITLKYEGNTASLISIEEDKKAIRGILTYKDKALVKYVLNEKNERQYTADYWRRAKGEIDDVTKYDVKNTPLGNYTLEYNTLKQISTIKSYSARNLLLSTKTLGYDDKGNMNQFNTTTGAEEKSLFTFDQKNGIFKHLDNAQLISFEFRHLLFNSIVNNVLSNIGTPAANDYTCSYEYQAEDYPRQVTVTQAGVKTVFTITYKIL